MELEKEIEDYFCWMVERRGGETLKFSSPGQRGVSDRIACMPDGSTYFIELKKPKGGRRSPLQEIFADKMARLNQSYYCLWTKGQIDDWAEGWSEVVPK